jgi:hypothetical protein
MLKAGRLVVGALAGVLLAWALLAGGCSRKAGDPIAVSVDGRTVALSRLVADYDRINGENQWRNASFDDRKAFAELVAKKELLVCHARELVGNTLPPREVIIRDRWLEKQIQATYWPKVRAAIPIPPAYIDSLAREMTNERYLRHVLCRKQEMAQEIYDKIKAGGDFVTLGQEYAKENDASGDAVYADVGWVSRPQLAPEVGTVLYDQLTAEGQVGEPVESARWGWHIIQLGGLRTREASEAKGDAEQLADMGYRSRKMQALIQDLQAQYAIEIVAENVGPILLHFTAMHDSLNALKAQGIVPDYQGLNPPLHRFSPAERALPIVRWSGGVMTIGDFLKTLWKVDLDYWPTTGDEGKIRTQIERRMTRWMLSEEADKRGALQGDPELQRHLANKEDELFLDAYYNSTLAVYRDAVSDADVQAHWQANEAEYKSQDLVGYGYIRFPGDLRDLASQTYDQIRAGAQWPLAASEARKADRRVDFENQLDPTSTGPYPQITAAAQKFAPQPDGSPTITEPLEVGNEWVILRVYFRQLPNTLTFEAAAPYVRRDLQRKVLEDTLAATLGSLEKRYHLKINEKALR